MYVLTLKQPWAHWVIHGPKDIENRSWCNEVVTRELIGKKRLLLIHAAQTETRDYWEDACKTALEIDPGIVIPDRDAVVRGALIGVCRVKGVVKPKQWEPKAEKRLRGPHRWHFAGQYGWLLEARAPLPSPIPCKGRLQLWELPASVLSMEGPQLMEGGRA